MELAPIVIPIVAVSAYFASVACRLVRRGHHRMSWYLVPVSSIAAAAIIVVVGYLGILSVPGDVPKIGGLHYWSRIAPAFFCLSVLVALLPGFVVFFLYRRKGKGENGL